MGWLSIVDAQQNPSLAKYVFKPIISWPEITQKQISFLSNDFKNIYGLYAESTRKEIIAYKQPFLEDKLLNNSDFEFIYRTEYWMSLDSANLHLIPFLIQQVTDTTYVGLTNANDITIWERVNKKQMEHHAYSYIIDDDLFTVAGRCNWLLKKISGKDNLERVKINPTKESLEALQKQWVDWWKTLIVNVK